MKNLVLIISFFTFVSANAANLIIYQNNISKDPVHIYSYSTGGVVPQSIYITSQGDTCLITKVLAEKNGITLGDIAAVIRSNHGVVTCYFDNKLNTIDVQIGEVNL